MRVLVLINGQPNQVALVHKLAAVCDVAAIVVSANIPRKPPRARARRFANRLAGRSVGRPFHDAWYSMLERYETRYGGLPDLPSTEVANVNDSPVLAAVESAAPDLVAVSGTNLLAPPLIEAAQRTGSVVNLHTGISPYVKGGPNCTNWCLARGWFDLIGSTVMWLDAGIDTGNLIATERAPLDGNETLDELHWKVMEHAQDLYVRAVAALVAGRTLPSVPQREVGDGPTFMTADWSALEMLRARRNFRRRYCDGVRQPARSHLRFLPLGESG